MTHARNRRQAIFGEGKIANTAYLQPRSGPAVYKEGYYPFELNYFLSVDVKTISRSTAERRDSKAKSHTIAPQPEHATHLPRASLESVKDFKGDISAEL